MDVFPPFVYFVLRQPSGLQFMVFSQVYGHPGRPPRSVGETLSHQEKARGCLPALTSDLYEFLGPEKWAVLLLALEAS